MSQLNVDIITGRDGQAAPEFTKGAIITGVVTATTLNQNVTGDQTGGRNISITGISTATGGFVGNLTGNVTGNVTGNSDTVTALQNARTIGGVSFDGTSNIDLPGVNQIGDQNTAGTAAGVHGTPDITVNNIVAAGATFSGVLTYEDVTNVDSVGLITARTGVKVTSGELTVGNNIKLGNAGVVTATSFVGALPISNDADNRIVTGNGSGGLNGEANLTFDGVNINQSMSSDGRGLIQTASGNNYIINTINANVTSADSLIGMVQAKWNGNHVADISFKSGADTTNKDDGWLQFRTSPSQGSIGERFRINHLGAFGLNGANYGSSGQVITSAGGNAAPTWATPSSGPEVFSDSTNSVGTIANGGTIKEWGITPTKAWTRAIFGWSGCYRAQSNGHVYIDVKARVNNGSWGNMITHGANTPAGSGSHTWNQGFTVTGELHGDGTRLTGAANHQVDILLTLESSMSIDHANDVGHDHNYWVMFFE